MLKRPARIVAALSLATLTFSPLAAQATPSGTNNQIVAACLDASLNAALCKYNADGSNKTILVSTTGSANYYVYGMSTDGTKVLVGVAEGGPAPQLFLLTPQTGSFTDLGMSVYGAAITPDGTKMVVSKDDGSGNDSLVAMNLDKTSPVTLVTAVATHTYQTVVISPDGATVAYSDQVFNSSTNTTTATVKTVPLSGGSPTDHSANLASGGTVLDWSPDGLSLLVTDGVNSASSSTGVPVASLTLSSDAVSDLITPSSNTAIYSAVYSPDGAKLLYDLTNTTATTDAVYTAAANGTGGAALAGVTTSMPLRGSVLAWSATDMGATQQANFTGAATPTPTPTPTPAPGLPAAGAIQLPWSLLVFGLLLVGAVEGARRFLRQG